MPSLDTEQNASSVALFQPESPFLETPQLLHTEEREGHEGHGGHGEHVIAERFWETESPFQHDVYALETSSPLASEFSELLAELYDETFNETVRDLAAEATALHTQQLTGEFQDREAAAAQAERLMAEHFGPLAQHAEQMLEQFAQTFGRYDLQSLTEAEIDRLAEQLHPPAGQLSPTFEQFLGDLFKKATGVVKGAVDLAKKGVAAVGKLGLGPILKKLKALVWPLLKRVIQFALNKLPAGVRPLAQKLASKLLGTKAEAEAAEAEGGALPAAATGEHVQFEFDIQTVQLLFASDEAEMEQFAAESAAAPQQFVDVAGDMDRARQRLIAELGELQPGQSAGPAIQNFLPAALVALQPIAKIAITIIGRPKVVNLIGDLLAKLIQRYVGAEGAKQLSRAVADVGLSLVGLEAPAQAPQSLGYEALAGALESTVTNLVNQPEYMFEDEALLEAATLQAFEEAVQGNFPSQLLKPQLQVQVGDPQTPSSFVLMPRNQRRKYYKKNFPVTQVEITPAVAKEVKTFGQATLDQFFREQLLLPDNATVKAKLHVYEAICGTWLGYISQMETNVGGLGSYSRQAYFQFHPLTPEAAVALKVPGLGKEVPPEFLAGREALAVGQRVYYLELPGQTRGVGRASYVRLEIDLKKGEIRLYIYLSEKRSQEIAQQLRTSGAVAGALQAIAESVGAFVDTVQRGSAGNAVRVIRETLEPEQLAMPTVSSVVQGASNAVGAVAGAVRNVVNAATGTVAGAAGSIVGNLAGGGIAGIAAGGAVPAAAGGAAGIGAAIGKAALSWLVKKILDWANLALGKWLVANKDLFIRYASDPSKRGVTIIVTFNPSQDLLRRVLLATVFPASLAVPPGRVELVAGPR